MPDRKIDLLIIRLLENARGDGLSRSALNKLNSFELRSLVNDIVELAAKIPEYQNGQST